MRNKGYMLLIILLIFVSACENRHSNSIRISKNNPQGNLVYKESLPNQDKEKIISFVTKSLDNPVFIEAKEEAERVSLQLGIKMEWLAPMTVDSKEQENIVESLIERKVDGIVISVLDTKKMTPLINKAVSEGIKVATFDSDAPKSNRAFYVGTDNYELGKVSGKSLVKIVNENKKYKRPLKVLIMTGVKESVNMQERIEGFKKATEELDLEIVDIVESFDDINRASELLENYVKENPDFDLFFSAGAWPLFSPPEGMISYKKWKENGGIAVIVDTFYPIVFAANKGLADALVGQSFKEMGRLSVENMYKLINGEEVKETMIYTELEFGNPNNYEELLKRKKPWEIK
ncbi:substrate-binding domain-containing protein [Niallia sp. Sow4_A1]|uniref:substrate-binding domain-containing protein n=1 Tax=Niallia sp. Sow4_A1 TaxID=3438793 RepID=UPI003F9DAE3D